MKNTGREKSALLLVLLFVCGGESQNEESVKCGKSSVIENRLNSVLSVRITGGSDVNQGSWPWISSIGLYRNGKFNHQCVGSVITKNIVLTAAHCFDPKHNQNWNTNTYKIRVGDNKINDKEDDRGRVQEMGIVQALAHPQYDGRYFDVGLLRTDREFRFNEWVQPICLPIDELAFPNIDGRSVKVAGWGSTVYKGPPSESLKVARLAVVPNSACDQNYRKVQNEFARGITNELLCAGDEFGGNDACQGDSGAPLAVFKYPERVHVQVGIVNSGYGCGAAGFPGIYARIQNDKIMRWIRNNLDPEDQDVPIVTDRPSNPNACRTTGGAQTGRQCQFPFRLQGKVMTTCTSLLSGGDTMPWCSTRTDQRGNHVGGSGNWGYCSDKCPLPELFVMRVGGFFKYKTSQYTNAVTAVSITNPNNIKTLRNYPIALGFATGQILSDKMTICGGYDQQRNDHNECYQYDPSRNQWVQLASMFEDRRGPVSTIVAGQMWVLGGGNRTSVHKSTEIYSNGVWRYGPNMPEPLQGHCAVQINDSLTFVAGGYNGRQITRMAWIYNWDNRQWKRLPDMAVPRENAACDPIIDGRSSGPQVLVTGGCSGICADGTALNTGQVYDVNTNRWRFVDEWDKAVTVNSADAQLQYFEGKPTYVEEVAEVILQYDDKNNRWTNLPFQLIDDRVATNFIVSEDKL